MKKPFYYLMDKTKSRVILETEFSFMVLSGNMYYLDKYKLEDLVSQCKPYHSYVKAKVNAWLYDLEVVTLSELVDILYNFKKQKEK